MKKVARLAGLSVLALSLTTGVAAAHNGSIGGSGSEDVAGTGPHSYNKVEVSSSDTRKLENDNDLFANNDTDQVSASGEARVEHNGVGGSAETGLADNESHTSTSATVVNGSVAAAFAGAGVGSSTGTIGSTGPHSYNKVDISEKSYVGVENDNYIKVNNTTNQQAYSGSATVSGNTTAGGATTGSATNLSHTTTTLSVTN